MIIVRIASVILLLAVMGTIALVAVTLSWDKRRECSISRPWAHAPLLCIRCAIAVVEARTLYRQPHRSRRRR